MAVRDYRIVPGLVTKEQDQDQEMLVCDTDSAVVHRVSGDTAAVLRQVLATGGGPVAFENDGITSGLVEAGVLVAVDAPAGFVSRRSLVSTAAAVGPIGIVALALPGAAAASSADDPDPSALESDPVVVTTLTRISYPADNPVAGTGDSNIEVRWLQFTGTGGGAFTFQVSIIGNAANSQVSETRTNLASNTTHTIFIANWADGEQITVTYVTTSLRNNVTGQNRTTTREV
jgi:hypothetical protein